MTSQAAATDPSTSYNHTWEKVDADINWATINEDSSGNLISSTNPNIQSLLPSTELANRIRSKRKHRSLIDHAQSSRRIVRDMIRYLYLLIDLSANMYEKDPDLGQGANATRLDVTLSLASQFVSEYFDQNPLCQLGIVVCRRGEATVLSPLSGSPRSASVALSALRESMGRGDLTGATAGQFSLQNGMEVAGRSLGHAPRYGSREVVMLVGALSTCDPGDVLVETLPRLVEAGVRVNCLALCAEMAVCRKICECSGGIMGVILNGGHLRDLWMKFTAPPPALPEEEEEEEEVVEEDGSRVVRKRTRRRKKRCEFVPMGFPTRITKPEPSLVHATDAMGKNDKIFFARTAYACPQCQAKSSELPTDCPVCALKLVLAPHLARSFHHLFPVPPFEELSEDVVVVSSGSDGGDRGVNGKEGPDVVPSITSSAEIPPRITSSGNNITTKPPSESSSNVGFTMPPNLGYHTSPSNTDNSNNNATTTNGSKSSSNNTPCRRVDSSEIDSSLLIDSKDSDRWCFVCLKIIGLRNLDEELPSSQQQQQQKQTPQLDGTKSSSISSSSSSKRKKKDKISTNVQYEIVPELLRFQCPDCGNVFCADCDSYLHETLHNCPGCLRL